MKTRFFLKFFVFASLATLICFTACKDYDDDIDKLETDLASLKSTVDAIQQNIKSGSTITEVEKIADGIIIKLSDGQTYTLTNGAEGKQGKEGSVVAIGDNGNWFIDGKDTGKASKGNDGIYYVPGEDGYWQEVDGETVVATTDKWLGEGTVTAKWEDGYVVLYNVEGSEEPVVIGLAAIENLFFIPQHVDKDGNSILNFSSFVSIDEVLQATTLAQYQVSPINTSENLIDKENLYFKFNTPEVLTRASDLNPKAEFVSLENGVLTVKAFIDADALGELINEESKKTAQLMLVVPTTLGNEIVSDWVNVVSYPTIAVSPNNVIMVGYTENEVKFTIDSGGNDWQYSLSGSTDWLTEESKTDTDLTLNVSENTTGAERYSNITFSIISSSAVKQEITISQNNNLIAADLLDVVFKEDGTAEDISPSKREIETLSNEARLTTLYNEKYERYFARFKGDGGGATSGFYKVPYHDDQEFKDALESGYTLEALFMNDRESFGAGHGILNSTQGGGTGLMIAKNGSSAEMRVIASINNSNYGWVSAWSGTTPEKDTYYHLVGVWNKEEAKLVLYVNGEEKQSIPTVGHYVHPWENNFEPVDASHWFGIGADPNRYNAEQTFSGDIVTARIYGNALSAQDVAELWNRVKD